MKNDFKMSPEEMMMASTLGFNFPKKTTEEPTEIKCQRCEDLFVPMAKERLCPPCEVQAVYAKKVRAKARREARNPNQKARGAKKLRKNKKKRRARRKV